MATHQPVTRTWVRPGGSGRGTYTPHYVVGWGARSACGIRVGGYGTTRPHSPYEGDRRCQRCDAAWRRDLDAAHAQAIVDDAVHRAESILRSWPRRAGKPDSLAAAVDAAIARENAAALADPTLDARAADDATRWAAWRAAEDAAGPHAVVLPVAAARDLLAVLDGAQPRVPMRVLAAMLRTRLAETARR